MRSRKYELAYALSEYAHEGQKDKAGNDYFNHPLTVSGLLTDETEKIVGLLHDVLEDTFVTEETLRNLFGDEITDHVVALTHKKGESYRDYIIRVGNDKVAAHVKMADLTHNMDLTRLKTVTDDDICRVEKYKQSYEYLKTVLKENE